MGRNQYIGIVRHVTEQELYRMVRELESRKGASRTDERVLRNLRFVQMRYAGMSVTECSDKLGISRKTGYNIQQAWNDGGFDGIVPHFSQGPPPRLSESETAEIIEMLSANPMNAAMLREHVAAVYGYTFSEKHLRKLFMAHGLRYSKDIDGDDNESDVTGEVDPDPSSDIM